MCRAAIDIDGVVYATAKALHFLRVIPNVLGEQHAPGGERAGLHVSGRRGWLAGKMPAAALRVAPIRGCQTGSVYRKFSARMMSLYDASN